MNRYKIKLKVSSMTLPVFGPFFDDEPFVRNFYVRAEDFDSAVTLAKESAAKDQLNVLEVVDSEVLS
jgi:hypothetical protein